MDQPEPGVRGLGQKRCRLADRFGHGGAFRGWACGVRMDGNESSYGECGVESVEHEWDLVGAVLDETGAAVWEDELAGQCGPSGQETPAVCGVPACSASGHCDR